MAETEISFDLVQVTSLALRCMVDVFLPFAVCFYLCKKHNGRWYPLIIGVTATILLVVPRALLRNMLISVLVMTAVRFAGCRKFLFLAIGLHVLSHFGTLFFGIVGILVVSSGICWLTYRRVKPYWMGEYAE